MSIQSYPVLFETPKGTKMMAKICTGKKSIFIDIGDRKSGKLSSVREKITIDYALKMDNKDALFGLEFEFNGFKTNINDRLIDGTGDNAPKAIYVGFGTSKTTGEKSEMWQKVKDYFTEIFADFSQETQKRQGEWAEINIDALAIGFVESLANIVEKKAVL